MALTGSTSGMRAPKAYPTTPPPLSASEMASFGQRRRQASRGLRTAMSRRESGKAEIDAFFEQFKGRLGRERKNVTRDTMGELGGRGQARQPRAAGRAMVRIRDEFSDRRAEGDLDRATRLSALEQMVNESRVSRDDVLSDIEADKARRRTALDQLLRQVGA